MPDNLDLFITVIGVAAGVIVTMFHKPNRKLGHGIILGSLATGGLILVSKNGEQALSLDTTSASNTIQDISDKLNEMTGEIKDLAIPSLTTSMVKTH